MSPSNSLLPLPLVAPTVLRPHATTHGGRTHLTCNNRLPERPLLVHTMDRIDLESVAVDVDDVVDWFSVATAPSAATAAPCPPQDRRQSDDPDPDLDPDL